MTPTRERGAMSAVWKFELSGAGDVIEIQMPQGAKPLFVAEQHGAVCLWARVNPENQLESRRFRWAGTGHTLDDVHVGPHVGSWMQFSGMLVWHLFEYVP